MNLFSKFLGKNKEYVKKINFSSYREVGELKATNLDNYNISIKIINDSLREYNSYYTNEFNKEPNQKNFLEMAAFTMAIIREIYHMKYVSQKTGFALYFSIREAYQSLNQSIIANGYRDYDEFFQSRVDCYNILIEKLVKSDQRLYINGIIKDLINIRPLMFIANNDPLNMPNISITDAYMSARFYDFISYALVTTIKKADEGIN